MSGLDPVSTGVAHGLRRHWVTTRPVLYHGTPTGGDILRANTLIIAPYGDRCVSLTRRPEVAAYFAMMTRDGPHDGAVLVIDRQLLATRYAIDVRHCGFWDGCGHGPEPWKFDEAEEAVWSSISDLSRYLIDVVKISAMFPGEQGEAA